MIVARRVQSASKLLKPLYSVKNNQLDFYSQIKSGKHNGDIVELKIDRDYLKFPSIWLRDNCQCEKCFHASAQSRIIDWNKFDVNIAPKEVEKNSNSVSIVWNDGHKSVFSLDWLKQRSFETNYQKLHNKFYKPEKVDWNGQDFPQILKRNDFNKLISSDRDLHDWLQHLAVYGVALVENSPSNENAVDAIIERIGFIRKTHYGEKFIVENRLDTSNVAYLSSNLQVHIDLPYYDYCPGLNILHCLTQTKSQGGNNILADGRYIAFYMKKNHPEEYDILKNIEVEWSDIGVEFGDDFHKLNRSPVICEERGEIRRINFSVPQRGSYFPTSIENVQSWYKAHKLFLELSHKFAASFKTNPGQMLCFDNIRLLHGRMEYTDEGENVRKLVGAYLDWDEIYSRLRCLKIKLRIH